MARLTRAEKLLGISSSPVHSTVLNSGDENELKEEDVWDAQEWPEENTPESHTSYGGSGGSYGTDSSESFRLFNNGKRWLGLEKDPGLSVAFTDGGGRTLGLSSLSPLKPANSSGNQSMSRSGGREVTPGRIATASRMIPPTGCAHRETTSRQMMHQSAPVNVPDWSKILGANKKSVAWVDDTVEEGKDDAQEKMLPPHELLAREYAKSQATTFSVFEGAGADPQRKGSEPSPHCSSQANGFSRLLTQGRSSKEEGIRAESAMQFSGKQKIDAASKPSSPPLPTPDTMTTNQSFSFLCG